MESILIKNIKKSGINANCDYDYCLVGQKRNYFINCSIEQGDDELQYSFDLESLKELEELAKSSLFYKYQFLINIALLHESKTKLNFSIEPSNLYFDANVIPNVLMRDVYRDTAYNEEQFAKEYKSLIGYLLNEKYSYDDFYKGGEKLLLKSKITTPFYELDTVDEIKATLSDEFRKYEEMNRSTKVEVNRKHYRNLKIYSRVSVILIIVLAIFASYFALFKTPESTATIKGNESFIAQDYITTIEVLDDVSMDNLSKSSKYIYAVSYIKSDALSNEQKNNILASVTVTSNDKILNYWIYLSRKDYTQSIDLAKQLGNKQYLLYGYLKYKSFTETDSSLDGAKRESKLKEIESSIKELTDTGVTSPNDDTNTEVNEGN